MRQPRQRQQTFIKTLIIRLSHQRRIHARHHNQIQSRPILPSTRAPPQIQLQVMLDTLLHLRNPPIPIQDIKERQRLPMSIHPQRKFPILIPHRINSSPIPKRKLQHLPTPRHPRRPRRNLDFVIPRKSNIPLERKRDRVKAMQLKERQTRGVSELAARTIAVLPS